MMKTCLYMLLILQVSFIALSAQSNGKGLYLSAHDFSDGKLAYVSKHTCIKPHDLFRKSVVEVKYHDSLFTYKKDKVFGYADKDGVYRFVDNENFPIVNPGERILIYKRTSGSGLKNSPIVETFYFSKNAGSTVQLLTLRNLLSVFESDPAFTKLVEICFTRSEDLTEYDTIHHKYRINRLLEIAQNQ